MAVSIQGYVGDAYLVGFDEHLIETTVTASGDAAHNWLAKIYRTHRRGLAGLDVEWRPSRQSGVAPGPVAVLQICVDHLCLVFQILQADYIPETLADQRFTFFGVGIQGEVDKLRANYGLNVGNAVDLRHLANHYLQRPELLNAGLQRMVWEVMGVRTDKPRRVQMSNWDAPQLSHEQLQYACADAFASFEVGRRLWDGEF